MTSIRTFAAIELSPPILHKIRTLLEQIKSDVPPGLVRWVRPEGIHLTLKFLGDVEASQIDAIAAALQGTCASHSFFSLSIGGMGVFPNPQRPRVVWIGVDEPEGALTRLQRDVERAIAPLGYPTERRPFSPHLTLGRVKNARKSAELEALGQYTSRARVRVGQMKVDTVYLMRSDLTPAGAIYGELAAAPLSGT